MSRTIFQKSCGVVPVNVDEAGVTRFLLLHSALVRNPKATWEFPKGSVEDGETDQQTALRECSEETGLTEVVLVDGYLAFDGYVFHREGTRIKKRVVYFVALVGDRDAVRSEPDGREHSLDADGRWHQWLEFEEAQQTLFHRGQRDILRSSFAHLLSLGYTDPGRFADLTAKVALPG